MELILFWIIVVAWAFTDTIYLIILRKKQPGKKNHRSKYRLMGWVFSGVILGMAFFWPTRYAFNQSFTLLRQTGLFIMAVGLILRITAIRYLKNSFNIDLTIPQNRRLVKEGPFRILRHPSYTGELLMFAGFGILMNNPLAAMVMLIFVFIGFNQRINEEEAFLMEVMKEEYGQYMSKTYKLLPYIY